MFTANVPVEFSIMLDGAGVNVYIGEAEMPTKGYSLNELTADMLDYYCDENGKVYAELADDVDGLLAQFKACVKMLEDAKR
jgi:hypothetical protein